MAHLSRPPPTRPSCIGDPPLMHRRAAPHLAASRPSSAQSPAQEVGTRSRSASQASALPSEGARQSPRGDSEPPADTFGPLGSADRLNWLNAKYLLMKTSSHRRIVARSYSARRSSGKFGGHSPASQLRQACQDKNAILLGRKP